MKKFRPYRLKLFYKKYNNFELNDKYEVVEKINYQETKQVSESKQFISELNNIFNIGSKIILLFFILIILFRISLSFVDNHELIFGIISYKLKNYVFLGIMIIPIIFISSLFYIKKTK